MRSYSDGIGRGLDPTTAAFQAGYDLALQVAQWQIERAERDADYWYLRARYTEAELREMYLRASTGDDPAPFDHPGHPAELDRTRAWAARGDERKERRHADAAA